MRQLGIVPKPAAGPVQQVDLGTEHRLGPIRRRGTSIGDHHGRRGADGSKEPCGHWLCRPLHTHREVAPDVATGCVVVVVGGGEVVVVVFGWDVDCEFEDAEPSSLPDDACCVDGGCVVEVEVGGTTVVALGAGLVVAVPVVAAELEPGRSCATTTPMS